MRFINSLSNASVWPESRISLLPVEQLFSEFDVTFAQQAPRLSFNEADGWYFLSLDMPGVKKDDIHIEIVEETLRIAAERKNHFGIGPESSATNYRKLFHNVRLPKSGDTGNLEAIYEDGVLTIVIPKAESAKPRKIQIQASEGGLNKLLGDFKRSTEHSNRMQNN